ncbi:hypothetical protein [Azospirillum doebereinerae]
MTLDAPATLAATLPRWAEEPPVPPEGSLVPGSRFAEEQWVMAAGMCGEVIVLTHSQRGEVGYKELKRLEILPF